MIKKLYMEKDAKRFLYQFKFSEKKAFESLQEAFRQSAEKGEFPGSSLEIGYFAEIRFPHAAKKS